MSDKSKLSKVGIDDTAVVCNLAQFFGTVKIGSGTVIHPTCKILAKGGSIEIGSNNIFEERVTITNPSNSNRTMTIGNNNLFEVGCTVESNKIGSANVIEIKAHLPEDTIIGNGCFVGVGVNLKPKDILNDGELVTINGKRIDSSVQKRHVTAIQQYLPILQQQLPLSHRMIKEKT